MLTRIFCLLLCLLLVAKGSVAAMLSPTGASGYAQPLTDHCPLAGLATSDDGDAAVEGWGALAAHDGTQGDERQGHRHHVLPLLGLSQAVGPSMTVAAPPPAGAAPVSANLSFSSELTAPPLHPPRRAD